MGLKKTHVKDCGKTSQCACGCPVAAEMHHRHTFTKLAMIPAGTGRKGKMEVSKHKQKLSSKTTESLLNKPNPKTNKNYKLQK